MSNSSFLPEDYLENKAERRTNLISLSLFAVVMIAVFSAFLVTNRQWAQVKTAQGSINSQYQDAAVQIEKLNELERQKDQMLKKAELAAALVERVPRSVLLAELINRMPPRLGLLEFNLKSEKIKVRKDAARGGTVGRLRGPQRAKTREEAAREQQKNVEAPRYQVTLSMVGVAPTDLEVSRYLSELNAYPLLSNVTLEYSEQREIDHETMRKFEITMMLKSDMDIRDIEPLHIPRRIKDPMTDRLQFNPLKQGNTASAEQGDKGRH